MITSFHAKYFAHELTRRHGPNDGSLQGLKLRLGEDRHEGIDEDGQTGFFHELVQNLFEVDRFSEQDLRRYDLNIVQHWNAITERRNKLEGTFITHCLPLKVPSR